LRVGFDFTRRFMGEVDVYVPTPTWGNHKNIIRDARMRIKDYRYWDKSTRGLDFAGLIADMKSAPNKSFFLLHACAHNPTGVDPTQSQWAEISSTCKVTIVILFDMFE